VGGTQRSRKTRGDAVGIPVIHGGEDVNSDRYKSHVAVKGAESLFNA